VPTVADWHEELFDARYLIYFEDSLLAGANIAEIDFIERALALEPSSRLLDVGCGFGRHAIPLALRGHRVTGVDRSAALLGAAGTISEKLGAEVDWRPGDMRDLGGLGPFDACLCLYTAFGYFSDAENARVLAGLRERLVPDGLLLLHLDNPLALLPDLPREDWSEAPRGVRRERHAYDALSGRLVSQRRLLLGPGRQLVLPESSVRLYAPHELRALLVASGFAVEQVHGDLEGAPVQWQRSRMLCWVARRR
jgi:SAM-dependent methyltransferase